MRRNDAAARRQAASASGRGVSTRAFSFLVLSFIIFAAIYSRPADLVSTLAQSLSTESKTRADGFGFSESTKVPTLTARDDESTSHALLLASMGTLVWFNVSSGKHKILHTGRGVYYGSFAGDDDDGEPTVWTVSRASVYSEEGEDRIIRIGALSGRLIQDKQLYGSIFTHEAVRTRDGKLVLVADTKHGKVIVLSHPSMSHVKTINAFTRNDHINSIHPTTHGTFWALLHGRSRDNSKLAEVHIETGNVLQIVTGYGDGAHGIVLVPSEGNRGDTFVYLNSNKGSLVKVTIPKRASVNNTPLRLKVSPQTLWKTPNKAFLKGICVVDGVAYFGSSPQSRGSRMDRLRVATSLVAYDLKAKRLLWVRDHTQIGTLGLINTIGTPRLSIAATYVETHSDEVPPTEAWSRFSTAAVVANPKIPDELSQSRRALLEARTTCAGTPAVLKNAMQVSSSSESRAVLNAAFYKLPLQFDPHALQTEVAKLQSRANWTFRGDINNSFIQLVSSNGNASDEAFRKMRVVENRLADMPYTSQVISSLGSFAGRCRLMKIPAGGSVTPHTDNRNQIAGDVPLVGHLLSSKGSGTYWGRRLRVHIPIQTTPSVTFVVGDVKMHMSSGSAYIFDNTYSHAVLNPSKEDRIHLVVDILPTLSTLRMIGRAERIGLRSQNVALGARVAGYDPALRDPMKIKPTYVKRVPHRVAAIIPEPWNDVDVFSTLSPKAIESVLFDSLLPRVVTSDACAAKVGELFELLNVTWSDALLATTFPQHVYDVDSRTLLRRITHSFLAGAADIECHCGRIHFSQSPMTLVDAADIIARVSHPDCTLENLPLALMRNKFLAETLGHASYPSFKGGFCLPRGLPN